MDLEECVTDRGTPLISRYESSQCFGDIKIGFDRVFGATSSWEIGSCRRTSTETHGGGFVCDGIGNTSNALLRAGRVLRKSDSKKQQHLRNFMPLVSLILEYIIIPMNAFFHRINTI